MKMYYKEEIVMNHINDNDSIFFDEFGNPYTSNDEYDDDYENADEAEDRFTRFMDN